MKYNGKPHRMNWQNFPIAQQVPILAKGCFQTGACTVASVSGKARYCVVKTAENGGGTPRETMARGQQHNLHKAIGSHSLYSRITFILLLTVLPKAHFNFTPGSLSYYLGTVYPRLTFIYREERRDKN